LIVLIINAHQVARQPSAERTDRCSLRKDQNLILCKDLSVGACGQATPVGEDQICCEWQQTRQIPSFTM
jgi:hypothetical protein